MTFTLTITCDNAAFAEDDGNMTSAALGAEIARILRQEAIKIEELISCGDEGRIFDVNGNKVGSWRMA